VRILFGGPRTALPALRWVSCFVVVIGFSSPVPPRNERVRSAVTSMMEYIRARLVTKAIHTPAGDMHVVRRQTHADSRANNKVLRIERCISKNLKYT